ncbi:hypothetical protein JCM1840_001822 [Sporobolomyces johnsonii]
MAFTVPVDRNSPTSATFDPLMLSLPFSLGSPPPFSRSSFDSPSSSSASSASLASPRSMDLPTPPSFFLSSLELDFNETIDPSLLLEASPSPPPTSFAPPPPSFAIRHVSPPTASGSPSFPPSLTLFPAPLSDSRAHDETCDQIRALTAILTSSALPSASIPAAPRSPPPPRSHLPSSSLSLKQQQAGKAKAEVLGWTTHDPAKNRPRQRTWLDALREAEIKAKLLKRPGMMQAAARL